MPRPLHRRLLAATLLLGLWGCESGPEYVYIPGPDYQQGLTVLADVPRDGRVAQGEWVTLHANRIMGPWQRVHRSEVPDSVTCRRKSVPPSPDLEIASKLKWQTLPAGAAKFNLPNPPDYDREIQFTRPGEYRLWAISDSPCGGVFTSDTIRVTVE